MTGRPAEGNGTGDPGGQRAAGLEAVRASWREVHPVPGVPPADVLELTSLRQLGAVRRHVRAFLTASLRADGVVAPDVVGDIVDTAILVVDELASNALRHGAQPASLDLREGGGHWVVVATDSAVDVLPTPAVDRPAGQGGYGLYVIADLTSAHGVEIDGDRKHVWALLAKDRRPGTR